ncbi:hypothetical protein KBC85_03615 [Candidatus Saccharibacteria bacterium]|nr:hypothetical protein [Candidatus Saccharibacteria bacterium]
MINYFINNKYKYLALVVLVLLMFVPTIVMAADPSPPAPGSTLEQRVAQRKQEQQVVLDETQTKRVQKQCKAAQVRLGSVIKDITKLSDNRSTTYRNVDGATLVAIGKLKIATKDTFALQQNRDEFAKQVAQFETTTAQYKQAIEDASLMNCEADPVGFMAMMATARSYNSMLSAQSKNISAVVADKIKPQLESFSKELQ